MSDPTQSEPRLHLHDVARRTVLRGAGLGSAPGLLSSIASIAAAGFTGWRDLERGILGTKGNAKLNLWRKRVGAPKAGEAPLPVVFLVHGSSNSAPCPTISLCRARANTR